MYLEATFRYSFSQNHLLIVVKQNIFDFNGHSWKFGQIDIYIKILFFIFGCRNSKYEVNGIINMIFFELLSEMWVLKYDNFYHSFFIITYIEIYLSLFVFPETPINSRKTKIIQLHRTFGANRSKAIYFKYTYSHIQISKFGVKTK